MINIHVVLATIRRSILAIVAVNKYFLTQISFGSWHDPAKQHLARVVFDVRQEGSAKKVITIRSALTISNKISSPLDVRMLAGNGLEGKTDVLYSQLNWFYKKIGRAHV